MSDRSDQRSSEGDWRAAPADTGRKPPRVPPWIIIIVLGLIAAGVAIYFLR